MPGPGARALISPLAGPLLVSRNEIRGPIDRFPEANFCSFTRHRASYEEEHKTGILIVAIHKKIICSLTVFFQVIHMAVVSEKVIYYSNSNSNNNDNNKNYYSLTSSCAVQTKIHGHGSDHRRSHGSSLCSCGDYANADKTSQRYLGLGLPFALFKTKFVHYHQVLKLIYLHDIPKEL